MKKKKITAKLIYKSFPLTFGFDPNGKEPWSMFGLEVGKGWYESIYKTAEKLEPLIIEQIKKDPEGYKYGYYRTAQLKEKYGTGRWYLSGGTDEMQDLVEAWETETENICEECGKPGKLRGQGWYYTRCHKHAKPEDRDNLEIVEDAYEKKEKENG